MKRRELAVAYRIYPGISKDPAAFPGDKRLFSELCLRSFRAALGGLDAKVFALLDDCPPEYETLFRSYFRPEDLEIVSFRPKLGNFGTFRKQIDILLAQDDSDAVYLAEDDYLYLPDSMGRLVSFLREHPDADFVTPYDHPDYYRLELHRRRETVRVSGGSHWRSAGTTCLTFLTTKTTLARTRRTLETFCAGAADASIWLSLTKRDVFNPAAVIRYLLTDRLHFSIVAGAWWYCWRENLFGKRRTLWAPLPGVATQMESTVLAVGRDWGATIREAERELLEARAARERSGAT